MLPWILALITIYSSNPSDGMNKTSFGRFPTEDACKEAGEAWSKEQKAAGREYQWYCFNTGGK